MNARWVHKHAAMFELDSCCAPGESASCLCLRTYADLTSIKGDADVVRGCTQGGFDLMLGCFAWLLLPDG